LNNFYKTCRKCSAKKVLDEFYIERRNRDGRMSYCKVCERKRVREHPTKKIRQAKYYQDNLEKITADHARWRLANPGRLIELEKAWAKANPDRYKEIHRFKRIRRRAAKSGVLVVATADQIRARWEYYGNKCWICRAPAEATDHVKPLSRGGAHLACNLRPICTSCNSRKGDRWPYPIKVSCTIPVVPGLSLP
jgi:5-methylcytosine-specific restriction endonuclease McrA